MTVSRDPSDYRPSNHAYNRSKERNIDWPLVASTIKDGEIRQADKPHQKLFVEDYYFTEYPVGVVVDPQDGQIITVEWRKD